MWTVQIEVIAAVRATTVYTAAVFSASQHPEAAAQLIELLISPAHASLRQQGGFLPL